MTDEKTRTPDARNNTVYRGVFDLEDGIVYPQRNNTVSTLPENYARELTEKLTEALRAIAPITRNNTPHRITIELTQEQLSRSSQKARAPYSQLTRIVDDS